MPRLTSGPRLLALLLVGLTLLLGCETSIEPIDKEAGLFSIYGYLTLTENRHYVRIRNLKDPIFDDSAAGVNATVTLENLETGTRDVLDDSIVVFQDVQTHNFESDLDVQPSDRYRITVERSDGESTQATATMPPFTTIEDTPSGAVECTEHMRLNFTNVPESRLLRIRAGIRWRSQWHWTQVEKARVEDSATPTTVFAPTTIIRKIVPERILISLGPPSEYCDILGKKQIRVAHTHFGPDWPADSLLADPVASQVENGLGVFGGLHRDTLAKEVIIP